MTDSLVYPAALGDRVTREGIPLTVAEKCEAQTGRWVCMTHPNDPDMIHFPTQLQKDIHVSDGRRHKMAWWCSEHGRLEVP